MSSNVDKYFDLTMTESDDGGGRDFLSLSSCYWCTCIMVVFMSCFLITCKMNINQLSSVYSCGSLKPLGHIAEIYSYFYDGVGL